MRFGARISNIFDRILNFTSGIIMILLGVMWFLVCLSVISRYFFKTPIGWTFEIVEYCLLWIAFLGAAWLLKEEGHAKMDLVISRLNSRNRALFDSVASILGTILCLAVTWYSGWKTWELFKVGDDWESLLRPPKALIIMIIPLGGVLLSIQFIRRTYHNLRPWIERKR